MIGHHCKTIWSTFETDVDLLGVDVAIRESNGFSLEIEVDANAEQSVQCASEQSLFAR